MIKKLVGQALFVLPGEFFAKSDVSCYAVSFIDGPFREAYPKQLFEIVRSHVNPYYFIMPELIQVHEYDLKNGTVYGKTLKSYITSFKDKDKTAEELCIHRNTLHYRLGRIKELFGIDVEDNDRALELMNCFQLLEVCENKAKE